MGEILLLIFLAGSSFPSLSGVLPHDSQSQLLQKLPHGSGADLSRVQGPFLPHETKKHLVLRTPEVITEM